MSGLKHTMPESDEEVQKQVEAIILNGDDVITIAPTGSRKSMTYWMPLFIHKTWDYCCGYPH